LVIRRRKEDWQQKKERKQRRLQGHGHRRRPQPGELLSRAQAQVFNVLMSTGTKGMMDILSGQLLEAAGMMIIKQHWIPLTTIPQLMVE